MELHGRYDEQTSSNYYTLKYHPDLLKLVM